MINRLLHITLLLLATACNNKQVSNPVWLNKKAVISVPSDTLNFETNTKNWTALLISFTQPVPIEIHEHKNGFTVTIKNNAGITEGPAQLILQHGSQYFLYDVSLQNIKTGAITEIDYRSPKTINPDSSLQQQRIVHTIDQWRNLLYTQGMLQYFYEEMISLSPVAGTTLAQKNKPVSAFYVQPGSTVAIPVKATYNKQERTFIVTAGPLKDKHNNTVADGTMLAFLYSNGQQTFRMEAALMNGYCSISIPAEANKTFHVTAVVNKTISQQILLKPE